MAYSNNNKLEMSTRFKLYPAVMSATSLGPVHATLVALPRLNSKLNFKVTEQQCKPCCIAFTLCINSCCCPCPGMPMNPAPAGGTLVSSRGENPRKSNGITLHERPLTNGDWGSHLVLSHLDSNHCQQPLCCYVCLLWPAHQLVCCIL